MGMSVGKEVQTEWETKVRDRGRWEASSRAEDGGGLVMGSWRLGQ